MIGRIFVCVLGLLFLSQAQDYSIFESSLFGGHEEDSASGIWIDHTRNAYYLAGTFQSLPPEFTGSIPPLHGGGGYDFGIAKIDLTTNEMIWWTFIPSYVSQVYDITGDSEGNVYLVGFTYSSTFPGTNSSEYKGQSDAVVAKISPGGAVVAAYQMGSEAGDTAYSVAVDESNSVVWVLGTTGSPPTFVISGCTTNQFIIGFTLSLSNFVAAQCVASAGTPYAAEVDPSTHQLVVASESSSANLLITKYSQDLTVVFSSTLASGVTYQNTPRLSIDTSGNTYVSFSNGCGALQILNSTNQVTFSGCVAELGAISAMAIDSKNRIYLLGTTSDGTGIAQLYPNGTTYFSAPFVNVEEKTFVGVGVLEESSGISLLCLSSVTEQTIDPVGVQYVNFTKAGSGDWYLVGVNLASVSPASSSSLTSGSIVHMTSASLTSGSNISGALAFGRRDFWIFSVLFFFMLFV